MEPVARLVTVVDLDDGVNGDRSMSVSALHLAVLGDGTRLVLLGDRGWSEQAPDDLWQRTAIDEIEDTARTVVGPDEPHDALTHADMARDHWAGLAGTLQRVGVDIGGDELSRLPHEVELSQRVRERLRRS